MLRVWSSQRFFYSIFCFLFLVTAFKASAERIGAHEIDSIAILKKNKNKRDLVKGLWRTKLLNGKEVYDNLGLDRENKGLETINGGHVKYRNGLRFKTLNPYFPRFVETLLASQNEDDLLYGKPEHTLSILIKKKRMGREKEVTHFNQKQIEKWYSELRKNQSPSKEVCAFRFKKGAESSYDLKTFESAEIALSEGYTITHQYQCGTCSSLKDLAVYIAKPDLTSPVRSCVKKLTRKGIKDCLIRQVGFSERCSETWAYNGDNTKLLCRRICLLDYGKGNLLRGLLNVLANKYEGGNTVKLPSGKEVLRPCLACDEYRSGPAFKYTAARTRRSSGLRSRIKRERSDMFIVNHYAYFKYFRKRGDEALEELLKDFWEIDE